MPSNAALTIKDGAATPADHTFMPTRIDANNIASFQERTSGVPVGYPTITWQLRAPNAGGQTYKLSGKLTVPKVINTTDSSGKAVTSVDYTNLATVEMVVSQRSTLQERKDLRVMLSNLLVNAAIATSSDSLESFW
jgi:hypothetical protein